MPRSRTWVALLAAFLSACLCVSFSPAQESRVEELNAQVMQLYGQGKYAEAVPIANEALKIAEASFGPNDSRVAIILINLASIYDEQGRFAEAESLYVRALSIDEKALGPADPTVATVLNNLAELYVHVGKYSQAEPLFQRALSIHEKAPGSHQTSIAIDLSNLAELYDIEGRFADAEPLYLRSLSIEEKELGPNHPNVASALDNLAELYVHKGNYARAQPLFERALRIHEKALGPDHPDVAVDLINLASLYMYQGKYAEPEPLYQRALSIDEKVFGANNPNVATDLNDLGVLYRLQGKYGEAEPFYQRALSIREKAFGPEHPDVAQSLENLGGLYDEEGKLAPAEPLFQRALSIREKALGPEHRSIATTVNNLAHLYSEQGRYAEARPLYERALRIWEKALGPDHHEVATGLDNLALLYEDEGNYAQAETLHLRALRIDEKALGPEHADVARDLNDLASLYSHEGKYSEAEPIYQRAVGIDEKAFGPEHPNVGRDLGNFGMLYRNMGRYDKAEQLYQRALSIDEKAFGPDHSNVARDINNLAVLLKDEGKYDQALKLELQALSIEQKALGPDHPEMATDLNNVALVYDEMGKFGDAETYYQRGFDGLFQQFQYSFTYMSEKERLGFLDKVANNFPVYFSFVHRYREKDQQLIGSMYNMLLWEKDFVAGSIADMRRAVEASGDAEALKLLGELSGKRTQIAALLNATPPDRDQWRKQIDQLKSEADGIEKGLVARSEVFAEKKKLERATWQQVRDALGPGEAAVEFVRYNYYDKTWAGTNYYVALVVTRESKEQPEYIFIGDGKEVEGDAITSIRRSVQARGISLEPEARLPGADAWELIWKPLEKALAGKKRIYLSPDGVLNQIPLGIIPAQGGKLLMEQYELRLLSSTKDILRSAAPRAAAAALLVGDPDFDLSEEQQVAAVRKLDEPQREAPVVMAALRVENRSRDLGSGSALPRLPGTGAEVNAIAELMKAHKWKTSLYTGDLALKRVVEQAGSPRVLHLATHGFFLPDQQMKTDRVGSSESQHSGLEDPMLRSGLYFAGANRVLAGKPTAQGLDNGVLTAMEAGSLDLRGTELVVLGACNTGQGDVKNGEGVFGLRRALEEAGAQSVLMSLWSVPDRETLELMQRFYKKWLSGVEIHEALKQAQLEMREQVRMSHNGKDLPYYWGAFVLVGR